MVDWLTKEEIQAKYKHISKHSLPFECSIIKIIPQKGIPFSERWKFLKNLFFITENGFYFQYGDVVPYGVKVNQEGEPFDVYLDGVLRCAYTYAYTSSPDVTTGFIKQILSKGRIYVNRNRNNDLYFVFVGVGYTYLRDSGGDNATPNTSNAANGNIFERKTHELLGPINMLYEDFSKIGNFWCVKKKSERPQLYKASTLKLLDISFDKIVYGEYSCEYTESSVVESGYDDYFIFKDGKWGCLDGEGNMIIDCLYDRIEHFGRYIDEGYIVTNFFRKGLISSKGECIIPCQYDKIEYLTEAIYNSKTLYWAKGNNKISVWDEEGHCLERNLDECICIDSCSEEEYDNYIQWDVFWIKKNGVGSIVRGCKFDSISNIAYNKFKDSKNLLGEVYIIVSKNNRFGIINAKGKVIIDYIYEDLSFIDDRRLLAYKGGKCGVIGFKEINIPIIYDELVPVVTASGGVNSYIGVIDGNKTILDINGNALFTNHNYDKVYVEDIYDKEKGFIVIGCSVSHEEKWGYVKQNGYPLIPCCYESIEAIISNNIIVAFKVRLNGLYGVIDVNNRFLIECQCSELYYFRTDLHNIFVYKRSDRSFYLAFIESEIELESKQYWQIEKELYRLGLGKVIQD